MNPPARPDAEDVIAGLYEAATGAAPWPAALSALAALTGSRGALITRPDRLHDGLLYTASLVDTVTQFFEEDWHSRDLRSQRVVTGAGPRRRIGFIRDQEIASCEERERGHYYSGFARSAGVPWFAVCGFTENGLAMGVSIQRSAAQGPFEDAELARLRTLEPHLWSVLRFSIQIASLKDRERLTGLDLVSQAALLLDREGRVRALNARAEALLPGVAHLREGRITALDTAARPGLDRLIAAACSPNRAFAANRERAALKPQRLVTAAGAVVLAQAIPMVRAAQDLFGDGHAILTLNPLTVAQPLGLTLLQSAFELTPAEAQVAQALCAGLDTAAIAEKLGVSEGAVRFHLKAIFPKAGVKRQAAFVALAAALRRPDGGPPGA